MALMRLDKFLSQNGIGTRTEVKKLMKSGAVTVNDSICQKPEMKINPEEDHICISGKPLSYDSSIWIMFHKPAGCVTATQDPMHKTVMDYISHPRKKELFPVGRLDIDTEGLLLITNEGNLAHRMLSPRHHVEKTYYVRTQGALPENLTEDFRNGIDIGEKNKTMPAVLKILCSDTVSEAELTICEGKYHQVKRMFQTAGYPVLYLKRISMGGITLDPNLESGNWRILNENERITLDRSCHL